MENRHKCFKELRDHLRMSRTALHSAPISDPFRGASQLGRYDSLSRGDPGQMTYLVASHRTGEQENCSKDGLAGRSYLSIKNGVLLYKQTIRPAWRSAARTHVRRLQMLQSKCLRLVTGADSRRFGCSFFSRSHQSPNCEFRLKVS